MTISFNLAPGVALGDAVEAMETATSENENAGKHPWDFSRHGPGIPASLANEPILILAALFRCT